MIDLDKLSRDELVRLRADVDRAIASVADREKRAALKAAEEAARERGFSLSDLMGLVAAAGGRGRGRRTASARAESAPPPARYRNPANPSQTWSGRGRRPGWIHELESAGRLAEAEIG
jgi:DNA-binding protein H-NS